MIHHNPIDFNSELKVVEKYNQYVELIHTKNIVTQMAINYGELIQENLWRQFNFKIKVYANVRYEKYAEVAPREKLNHQTPIENINNLTRLQLNDLDFITRLEHEIRRRQMQGSGWNFQDINYLKIYFHKSNASNGRTYFKFPIRTNSSLNIQHTDTYCFLCCILASIHPIDKDPQRVSKYEPYKKELHFKIQISQML